MALNILLIVLQFFMVYSVYKLIFPKLNLIEGFCVSFLILNGLFSFLLFIIGWAGIPITKNTFIFISSILSIISLISLFFKRVNFKSDILQFGNMKREIKNMSRLEKVLVFLFVLLVFLVFLINLYWPLWLWDVLTLYEFRADVILKTGNLSSFLQFGPYYLTHPLFTTMTHVWLYLMGFRNVKFIYALYYGVFGLLFYNLLRKKTLRKVSLFFTISMLTTGSLFSAVDASYSNLPYAVFFVTGALYLFNYFRDNRKDYLVISSFCLAFSIWSRALEPYWVVCLVSLLLFLYLSHSKKKMNTIIIFLVPIAVVYASWNIFSHTAGGGNLDINSNYVASQVTSSGVSNIFAVLVWNVSFVYKNFISPNLILLLSFIISLILNGERKYKLYGLGYIVGLILISYAGSVVYYYMVGKTNWAQLGDSLFRMSVIMPPLLLYFIGENLAGITNKQLAKE